MQIQITKLLEKPLGQIRNDGLAEPKRCYSNVSQIVLSGKISGAKYILCWVRDSAEGLHGHAVFESDEKYFDPTLQANSGISTYYQHVKTFTREELISLLTSEFGANFMSLGFVPPALMEDGQISCVEVEN